jgi:hypothetical protein
MPHLDPRVGRAFRTAVPVSQSAEPPELELDVIELPDGSPALGMILRRACPPSTT